MIWFPTRTFLMTRDCGLPWLLQVADYGAVVFMTPTRFSQSFAGKNEFLMNNRIFPIVNACAVVTLAYLSRTYVDQLIVVVIAFVFGIGAGFCAVLTKNRTKFYAGTNFSIGVMWAVYILVVGVLSFGCFWLQNHKELSDLANNRLAQLVLTYLLGSCVVIMRPDPKQVV